jgi:hypothetical protein
MAIIVFWILLSIAVAMFAAKRGRHGFGWFLISAVISPLLGFIFLLVSKDLSKDDELRVPCPKCSEKVLITASICPHCKSDLATNLNFIEAADALKQKPDEDRKNLMIGVGFIVGLIFIVKIIDSF